MIPVCPVSRFSTRAAALCCGLDELTHKGFDSPDHFSFQVTTRHDGSSVRIESEEDLHSANRSGESTKAPDHHQDKVTMTCEKSSRDKKGGGGSLVTQQTRWVFENPMLSLFLYVSSDVVNTCFCCS